MSYFKSKELRRRGEMSNQLSQYSWRVSVAAQCVGVTRPCLHVLTTAFSLVSHSSVSSWPGIPPK